MTSIAVPIAPKVNHNVSSPSLLEFSSLFSVVVNAVFVGFDLMTLYVSQLK